MTGAELNRVIAGVCIVVLVKVLVRQTVFGIEKAEILFVMQVEGEFRVTGGTRAIIGG